MKKLQSTRQKLALHMILVMLVWCLAVPLLAQVTDTIVKPTFGIGTRDFMISGQINTWWTPDHRIAFDRLWGFTHALGLNYMQINGAQAYTSIKKLYNSTLRDSLRADSVDRLTIIDGILMWCGRSQAVDFYPFDSVQTLRYQWKFVKRHGGSPHQTDIQITPIETQPLLEQWYSTASADSVSAGDTILSDISYHWTTRQQFRYLQPWTTWTSPSFPDSIQQSDDFITQHNDVTDTNVTKTDSVSFVVVTGHLFAEGASNQTDSLLRVEIIYEIPKNVDPNRKVVRYRGSDALWHAAGQDTSIPVTTLYVTKSQLFPDTVHGQVFNQYQEAAFPINLQWCDNGAAGPRQPESFKPGGDSFSYSHRFNIRVTWLGGEKLALRSIGLRDQVSQLLLGQELVCDTFRTKMINTAKGYLKSGTPSDTLRTRIARLEIGAEAKWHPIEFAGFDAMDTLLRHHFHVSASYVPPNTDTSFSPFQWDLAGRTFHTLSTPTSVSEYMYINNAFDTNSYFNGVDYSRDSLQKPQLMYESPLRGVPSIVEHNGGKGHLLVLTVDSSGVENYEIAVNRMFWGHYMTDRDFPTASEGMLSHLGRAATIARDTRRRLIPVAGTISVIALRADVVNRHTDTILSHIPERSELRTIVNLALCYGSRGIHYWAIGGFQGGYSKVKVPPVDSTQDTVTLVTLGDPKSQGGCCAGSAGYYTQDTVPNMMRYELYARYPIEDSTDSIGHIDSFYIGRTDRSRELKWLNKRWLLKWDTVGGKEKITGGITRPLMNLRWHDAYSIHFTERDPSLLRDTLFRPIADTEIVASVRTRSVWYPTLDPINRTYVELGLFEKQTDDSGRDVHHVFIVNRRCFERPDTISPDSARGHLMDSLSGTRVIYVKFRLDHPDHSQYNFVRVREIEPDTTRLPMGITSRQPLDTAIYGDSACAITLRPGGAALLEITYLNPADALTGGDLRLNGQRRLVWDSRRYHMVYTRDSAGSKRIYYRRSVYIQRPVDSIATIGQIQWEPYEKAISDPTDTHHTLHAFPSLTLGINRLNSADTVITFVWDTYNTDSSKRQIVLRRLKYNAMLDSLEFLEAVSTHSGLNPEQWGTPVISTMDFGEAIAWSDSLHGIYATMRTHGDSGYYWWWRVPILSGGGYSTIVNVKDNHYGPDRRTWEQYPSLPTFTHITARDSTCGLVWQEYDSAFIDPTPERYNIWYARLKDTSSGNTALVKNIGPLPTETQFNFHPSIDQTQDVWGNIQEGVAWQSVDRAPGGPMPPSDNYSIAFRALYTPSDSVNHVRSNQYATQTWGTSYEVMGSFPRNSSYYCPNTAALNYRYDSTTQNEKVLFSVVYDNGTSAYQDIMEYGAGSGDQMIFGAPKVYMYGGLYPTSSANLVFREPWSPDSIITIDTTTTPPDTTLLKWAWRKEYWNRQPVRPAVVYLVDDTLLRTTKQFFAGKLRPDGYMARGRSLNLGLENSGQTRICVGFQDAWYATGSTAGGLQVINRDSTLLRTDSLSQVRQLLRTKSFHGGDSVQIGYELIGTFIGDSAVAGNASVTCVAELVDSASGTVVARLDTFVVSSNSRRYRQVSSPVLDLVTGTYYMRLTVDTANIPSVNPKPYSNYPVAELFKWIEHNHDAKLTGLDSLPAEKRIAAYEQFLAQLTVTGRRVGYGDDLTMRNTEVMMSIGEKSM
jgi:hypothetical protein